MTGKKVYAVARGRATGIFTTWAECERHVKGFEGARYKSFTDVGEALAWLSGGWKKGTTQRSSSLPPWGRCPEGADKQTLGASAPSGRLCRSRQRVTAYRDAQPSPPVDYTIYTDGSCLKNPGGPGGWAIVAKNEATGAVTEQNGGDPMTPNNRMELTAAIMALRLAPEGTHVALYTDSQYLKNGITKWVAGWKRRGWRKSDGQPVLNQPLWMELDKLYSAHTVTFHWVKGHAGNPLNERCDQLAKAAAMKHKNK